MVNSQPKIREFGVPARCPMSSKISDDTAVGFHTHLELDTLIFSSIEPNLAGPLSLNQNPRAYTQQHELRLERHDSTASYHSQARGSSSQFAFRSLPPIRRMPSLQVPSLTDISTYHPSSLTTQRSLHKISEKEPSSYQLPVTLVHPNSPYVPWEAPVRQRILCTISVAPQREDTATNLDLLDKDPQEAPQIEVAHSKNPNALASIWNSMKAAPKVLKERCQRLLHGRSNQPSTSPNSQQVFDTESLEDHAQTMIYSPHSRSDLPYSPTASFRSADTNTLAVWLSECHRKFVDKDCESSRLLSIDEYERVGSWIKTGDFASPSRMSYQCSLTDGETISSFQICEAEGEPLEITASSADQSSILSAASSPLRSHFPTKRVVDAEKLSRLVHRASMRSYLAERPISVSNAWST